MKQLMIVAALAVLMGCGSDSETKSLAANDARAAVFKSVAADNVLDVGAARVLPPGTPVTVRCRIVGTAEPFAKEQAMVTVADPSVAKAFFNMPIPHKSCCVAPEVKGPHMMVIQVADAEGDAVSGTLKGVNGLKELDFLRVKGTMAKESTATAPMLNVEALEVIPAWGDFDVK